MRTTFSLLCLTALALLLVVTTCAVMPWDVMFPDFIAYWTAGTLVARGQNPYDVDLQIALQHGLGWSRSFQGRGVLEFLPYYYPPWFAMACAGLVPLGFGGARIAWYFLNLEMLFLAGYLLRSSVPGLSATIPIVAVPLFLLSLISLLLGQTTILIAFLLAAAWRLLDRHRDFAGGAMLACALTKPQLAAVLVVALGLWAVRQGRWRVVGGLTAMLALLCLVSTAVVPSWPVAMLQAIQQTHPPTETFPWLGNTWPLLLQAVGFTGWTLRGLYAAVAVPTLFAVARAALDSRRPLQDVFALGLLAVFFAVPYARHYDFVVLLIPAFVLIGARLSEKAGAALLVALLLIPYLQFVILVRYSRLVVPGVDFHLECTYFWIPVTLAALWYASVPGRRRPTAPPVARLAAGSSLTDESARCPEPPA